jgi:hypothetical protein
MANSHLTFTSEATAIAAQKQIWINMVKARALEGSDLVGDGTTHYSDLSGLTDEEISQLKIYSSYNGVVDPTLGATIQYATVRQAYGLSKWFFKKPSAEYMTDVIDYATEDYTTDWEDPDLYNS